MPVVGATAGLVGRVISTTPDGATVRLITDTHSAVGVDLRIGQHDARRLGTGVNNGTRCATSVPLTAPPSSRGPSSRPTDSTAGSTRRAFPSRRVQTSPSRPALRPTTSSLAARRGPAPPHLPRRGALGALGVRRAAGPGDCGRRCSSSRSSSRCSRRCAFAGVVVMLVWLWPLAMGLAGLTALSLLGALVAGVFFDTHAMTPFGLTALVAILLAYGASRLGREGVGDLDSAAWWVTPVARRRRGLRRARSLRGRELRRPSTSRSGATACLRRWSSTPWRSSCWRDRWRGSLDGSRTVGMRAMRGRGANVRIGSWFSRLWRPWVSLHPFRGRGRTINEPKPVGIRDLMAAPEEVPLAPHTALDRDRGVLPRATGRCSSCGSSSSRSSTTTPRSRPCSRTRCA